MNSDSRNPDPKNFENADALKIFTISTFIICICEAGGARLGDFLAPISRIAVTRLLQIFLLVGFLSVTPHGIGFAGLSKSKFAHGLKIGLIWSFVFGGVVSVAALVLFLNHINPLKLIRSDLPQKNLALFLLVGGGIGPIAEELYFRGILYSFLRKSGVLMAMGTTTLVFALFHFSGNTLPIIQIVGGLVFAASFEYSKSLITPIIIHCFGNLAIFSLSIFL
jgi:membrane protease YdiL (CAAX protease family)